MKPKSIAFLMLVLVSGVLALGQGNAAQPSIVMVGTIGDVTFGVPPDTLVNAPNGHISFQKIIGGYRVWVPGRLPITPTPTATLISSASPSAHEEGGFAFDVTDWPSLELPTPPTFVLGHVKDDNNPNCSPIIYSFDRDYKALNAVVPGPNPNTLWGFYDAEYHVTCSSEPLLSSIGMATSNDGGITWNDNGQVIQGLDAAKFGAANTDDPDYDDDSVIDKQFAKANPSPTGDPVSIDSGASGPSAVIPGDGYIYVYYADRTPFTKRPDSIYVERARTSASPSPSPGLEWEKWMGDSWVPASTQTLATAILVPSATAVIALQPHVSWNTSLHEWLMVFKTAIDFEVATSVDGVHWNPPVSLLTFDPNDDKTGFPTLISIDEGETSQQITGPNVWLYYSSLPKVSPVPTPGITPLDPFHYHGHVVQFTIRDTTPPVTSATVAGPLGLNDWYTGPTTVSFTATDDLSGVAGTEYSLDNGATWTAANSVWFTASASYNLLYRSTDVDGNVETAKSLTVRLDSRPPAITATANPSTILNHLHVVSVTISGNIADNLSGVDPTTARFAVHDEYGRVQPTGGVTIAADGSYSFTISLRTFVRVNDTDGRLYTIRVSAVDNAGNKRTIETFVTAKRRRQPPCAPHCI